jgi:hypothetical protein
MRASVGARRLPAMPQGQPIRVTDMPRSLVQRAFPDGRQIPVRKTAARNALPVDQITQVRVLDRYFDS